MITNYIKTHIIEINLYHTIDGHIGTYKFTRPRRQSLHKFIQKSIEQVQARSGIEDFTDYNFIMKIRKV